MGRKHPYKIDCDSLSEGDLVCIAAMMHERLPSFGAVGGVPRGGLQG